jgi:hypothetical protein
MVEPSGMTSVGWRDAVVGFVLGVLASGALAVVLWPSSGNTSSQQHAEGGSGESGQKPPELTPEEKMARRHPQKVRVGDLIGQPVLDHSDRVLGHVRKVVRTSDGRLQLVTGYGGFLGFGQRLVAVPVEVVALLGLQVAALDWPIEMFELAPTWFGSGAHELESDEIIRLAITKR